MWGINDLVLRKCYIYYVGNLMENIILYGVCYINLCFIYFKFLGLEIEKLYVFRKKKKKRWEVMCYDDVVFLNNV